MIVFDQRIPIKYSLHKKIDSKLYFKQRWPNDIYESLKDGYSKLSGIKLDLVEIGLNPNMEDLYFHRTSLMGREKP